MLIIEKQYKELDFLGEHFPKEVISDIIEKYSEPWRAYHTIEHVIDLLDKIKKSTFSKDDESNLILKITAVFHDVIYFPWNIKSGGEYTLGRSNEELSADYFEEVWSKSTLYKSNLFYTVYDIIKATESHITSSEIGQEFMLFDMFIFQETDWTKVLKWEEGIRKEYSFVSTSDYKKSRLNFLNAYKHSSDNIKNLIQYVDNYRPRVAFYAGSFNPIHNGHLDIIEKAKTMFDKVVILIGQNPSKDKITDTEERVENVFKKTACEVVSFEGFLPTYLEERSSTEDVFLIRGFRNNEDIAYEQNNAKLMKDIWSDINMIYLPSETEYHHVSSSAIKALNRIKSGEGDKYIPKDLF